MYFNCQTRLVESFRPMFPNDFGFEGNRALVMELKQALPVDAVGLCVVAAFTCHLNRRRNLFMGRR